ncbi:bifunctional heptose 7-phosphate kinase/heptose 1-phosphate adenyltransferase [Candidatus Neomarinimicrobiota bacterium]
MKPERLAVLIERFSSRRIVVLGDFFLDKYLHVDPELSELSVETGKTAHQVVAVRHSPGVAGTVVGNLAALGAKTLHAIGFTGDDGEGYDLRRDLARLNCSTDRLYQSSDRMTPTYLKPRDKSVPGLAGEHNRYDTKNRTPAQTALIEQMIAALDALLASVDAVIIADQVEYPDCGVVTSVMRTALAERALKNPDIIFWADSRTNIRHFRNVIIKPNQFEAVGWENPVPGDTVSMEDLRAIIIRLRQTVNGPICVTCGAAGMMVSDPEPIVVRSVHVDDPIDITGAGDSATAGAVLALASGATLPEAALLGNLVASITIQQLNTTGVARPDQLPPQLELWRAQEDRTQ